MRGTLLLFAALIVGCYGDPPTVTGGEARFDAAAPAAEDVFKIDRAGGSTWPELYRDYFGPSGAASCAGSGVCHGASDQPGAKASGYVCAGSADDCYAGMVKGHLFIPGDTSKAPDAVVLHVVLRKSDGTGFMPKSPAKVFGTGDMARIDAWLAAGAPSGAAPLPGDAGAD